MPLDVQAFRAEFPSLESGIAHFDGPGGTQTPLVVGEAIARAITSPLSNRGRLLASQINADDAVLAFREAYADLLNADPRGIVYGRSATQLIYDFSRSLAKTWGPGDEVVVSRLDHDSNIRPWIQAAEAVGATVRWIEFDPATTSFGVADVEAVLSEQTRLVALTGASNLFGTRPPLAEIARSVHAAGALFFVDGVHYTPHAVVDVKAIGADFFVCSPYKFFGPHCGVLAADPELLETLRPDKLFPSADSVPDRFEFGTLPYEIMAGATAAVDFLASAGLGSGDGIADSEGVADSEGAGSRRERLVASLAALEEHETELLAVLEAGLAGIDGVTRRSLAADRTPTMAITLAGRMPQEVSAFLATRDVLAPSGSFYAWEAFEASGIGGDGIVRIGLASYNDRGDVERLLAGLRELAGSGE